MPDVCAVMRHLFSQLWEIGGELLLTEEKTEAQV